MLKRSVTFELSLKVSLVVLKLALFYGIDTIVAKVDHLGQAEDLRRHICYIQAIFTALALF